MKIHATCPRYAIVDFGKGPVEIRCTVGGAHKTHKCDVLILDSMRSNSLKKEDKDNHGSH